MTQPNTVRCLNKACECTLFPEVYRGTILFCCNCLEGSVTGTLQCNECRQDVLCRLKPTGVCQSCTIRRAIREQREQINRLTAVQQQYRALISTAGSYNRAAHLLSLGEIAEHANELDLPDE